MSDAPPSDRVKTLLQGVVRRLRGGSRERERRWLRDLGVRTALDIGANTGQFARELRELYPNAMVYSFEPLPDCHEALTRAFRGDPRFRAFNVALGDARGEVTMHRSAWSPSSSLLAMGESHKRAFPHTSEERPQVVKCERLDDLASELVLEAPLLVKMDVQGFEDRVLAGGPEVFKRASVVLTEMSVEPLYEGQVLFDGLYRALVDLGFRYRGNLNQLHSPEDGRVLQVDGIFTRGT
ncbi:MAG: FkbM family methyltransferase [Deltaproteobacteria bacterium]|nr:FkbM family methyltransferase [Deltaproteobacteria bacterium]